MSEGPVRAAIRRMISVRWRLRIWGVVAIAFAFVVGLVPLMSVLGYPLALAASLLGSIAGLDIGCAFAKELQRASGGAVSAIEHATWPGRMLARSTVAAAGLAILVMLLPVPICAIRGLWVPTCDWWFGITSYVALPLVTTALAAALGHCIGVVVGMRRFVGGALCVAAWLGVALAAFWRFYSEPPVFTYNAIVGYFPGNLYDENIKLKAALWWSRLEQVAWLVALGAFVAARFDVPSHRVRWRAPRPDGGRRRAAATGTASLVLAAVLFAQSGRLEYRIDDDDIMEALGGRTETEHFVIYHSLRPRIVEDIEVIARDHEFRYAQIVAQTGVAPRGKLRSFYFASRAQKYRLFGAKDVEMAKPWLGDIYLEHRSFPHTSLRHEIAHAVASAFGDPIFGVAAGRVLGVPALFSPGLIEGLAVALDWPGRYETYTPHESVRALQKQAKAPSLDQLFGLGFLTFSSARAYTTAGSFMRFLLERHGAEPVRALYHSGGDFEHAFNASRGELEREWHELLASIEVPPALVRALEERYRVGSVFARPCPLANAKRAEQAARAAAEGDRERAIELIREICEDAPEEPRYRQALASYLHDGTAAQMAEADLIWGALANDQGLTSTLRARALEGRAEIAMRRGDVVIARQLIAEALQLPIEAADRRQIENKAFALAHEGPAAEPLRTYAFPSPEGHDGLVLAEEMTTREPTLGHGHYLLGIQLLARREYARAAAAFERAFARGMIGRPFEQNGARLLAVAAYRAKQRAGVERAIAILGAADMTTGDKLLANDWAERLAFDAALR